jgi:hypothetical protein
MTISSLTCTVAIHVIVLQTNKRGWEVDAGERRCGQSLIALNHETGDILVAFPLKGQEKSADISWEGKGEQRMRGERTLGRPSGTSTVLDP